MEACRALPWVFWLMIGWLYTVSSLTAGSWPLSRPILSKNITLTVPSQDCAHARTHTNLCFWLRLKPGQHTLMVSYKYNNAQPSNKIFSSICCFFPLFVLTEYAEIEECTLRQNSLDGTRVLFPMALSAAAKPSSQTLTHTLFMWSIHSIVLNKSKQKAKLLQNKNVQTFTGDLLCKFQLDNFYASNHSLCLPSLGLQEPITSCHMARGGVHPGRSPVYRRALT